MASKPVEKGEEQLGKEQKIYELETELALGNMRNQFKEETKWLEERNLSVDEANAILRAKRLAIYEK